MASPRFIYNSNDGFLCRSNGGGRRPREDYFGETFAMNAK
jgi:hypothetical protein